VRHLSPIKDHLMLLEKNNKSNQLSLISMQKDIPDFSK